MICIGTGLYYDTLHTRFGQLIILFTEIPCENSKSEKKPSKFKEEIILNDTLWNLSQYLKKESLESKKEYCDMEKFYVI